jgi:hypothetical protein
MSGRRHGPWRPAHASDANETCARAAGVWASTCDQNDCRSSTHRCAGPPPGSVGDPRSQAARRRRPRHTTLIVQADVEDRVHHARYRELRPRAARDQKRVLGVTEALLGPRLEGLHGRDLLLPHPLRKGAVVGQVEIARNGRPTGWDSRSVSRRPAGLQVSQPGMAWVRRWPCRSAQGGRSWSTRASPDVQCARRRYEGPKAKSDCGRANTPQPKLSQLAETAALSLAQALSSSASS